MICLLLFLSFCAGLNLSSNYSLDIVSFCMFIFQSILFKDILLFVANYSVFILIFHAFSVNHPLSF